jgi:hypothetical protein
MDILASWKASVADEGLWSMLSIAAVVKCHS